MKNITARVLVGFVTFLALALGTSFATPTMACCGTPGNPGMACCAHNPGMACCHFNHK